MSLSPLMIVAVAAGGAVGAVCRYLVGHVALKLMGPGFPWGTITVNIVGSFLMGVVIHMLAVKAGFSKEMTAFVTVGVLGGFTTFSTFSLDVVTLMERGQIAPAALYVGSSVVVGVGMLFAGLAASRWLVP